MFRRQTDQVYSTLQQVQRRITEQAGTPQVPVDELNPQPPAAVNLQPLSQALPQVAGAPAPVQPFPTLPTGSGKRYVLQLSGDLAMLLMVVWLVSMAVMFYLGKNWRASPGAALSGGAHADVVSDAPAVARQGDYVLVLQSSPTASVEVEKFFQGRARELNDFVARNPSRGWKAYFGVRKPISGGVQLVFGTVDGQFGVSKDEFLAFGNMLALPQSKGGAGYPSAIWVRVDGP